MVGALVLSCAPRIDCGSYDKAINHGGSSGGSLGKINAAVDKGEFELAVTVEISTSDGDLSLIIDKGWNIRKNRRGGDQRDERYVN